jgi:hypothetical protein
MTGRAAATALHLAAVNADLFTPFASGEESAYLDNDPSPPSRFRDLLSPPRQILRSDAPPTHGGRQIARVPPSADLDPDDRTSASLLHPHGPEVTYAA